MNPLLWLAEGMAARGHEPTFLITPHYGRLVQQHGFSGRPSERKKNSFASRAIHAFGIPRKERRWSSKACSKRFSLSRGFATAGYDFDLVVLSSMAMGAASVAEARAFRDSPPHAAGLISQYPRLSGLHGRALRLARSPRWVKRFFSAWWTFFLGNRSQTVKCLPQRDGSATVRNFYTGAFHGAEGVAALFPEGCSSAARLAAGGPPIRFSSCYLPATPLPESLEAFLGSGDRRWPGRMAQPISIFSISNPELLRSHRSSNCAAC